MYLTETKDMILVGRSKYGDKATATRSYLK